MKPLCMVPFTRAFVYANGVFRPCCSTQKILVDRDHQPFADWWSGAQMQKFRQNLMQDRLPEACLKCEITESLRGASFRTNVNEQNADIDIESCKEYPNSWHVMFGNTCNLACWTCSENSSSVIATQKTKLQMVPHNFLDPNQQFLEVWPEIRQDIINSYAHHDSILLTVLGGEPMYNPVVIEFLQELVDKGLSKRTKIEITTNGTRLSAKIADMLHHDQWQYMSIFVSVDAVGALGEAVRYGSKWQDVSVNVDHYKKIANHMEIHTMVSILNLHGLPELARWCKDQGLNHFIMPISYPWYFDIHHWDAGHDWINRTEFQDTELSGYLNLIGSTARPGAKAAAKTYIETMAQLRPEFQRSDHAFSHILSS